MSWKEVGHKHGEIARRAARRFLALLLLGFAATAAAAPRQPYTVADELTGTARIGSRVLDDRQLDRAIDEVVAGSPRQSREIGGIMFAGEPAELLDALFLLVGRELRKDQELARRHPELAGVGVRDAVKRLFGAETGTRLLYLLVRHHYNGSHLAFEDAAPWQPAQLDEAIATLRDLPPSARPYDPEVVRPLLLDSGSRGLARFGSASAHSVASGKGVVLAVSGPERIGIRLSGLWTLSSAARKRAILAHEFAHDIVRLQAYDRNWAAEWLAASVSDAATAGRPAGHASLYATTNWVEDMAESLTAYRYRPALLKHQAPNRYALLRDRLFGGREY